MELQTHLPEAQRSPLRTSNSQQQFVTSLKNGKLGIFRAQSTRTELNSIFTKTDDVWQTDSGSVYVYVGALEMLFDDQREGLRRFVVKFHDWEGPQGWQKQSNLTWLDWLAPMSFDSIFKTVDQAEVPFQVIEFTDGSRGLLRVKLPATVMLVFDVVGTLYSLSVDFENPLRTLAAMQTVSSFHR